jgi:uncharacterized protein (DUF1330 family)
MKGRHWNRESMILIEFETLGHLQKCFQSSEYLELPHSPFIGLHQEE